MRLAPDSLGGKIAFVGIPAAVVVLALAAGNTGGGEDPNAAPAAPASADPTFEPQPITGQEKEKLDSAAASVISLAIDKHEKFVRSGECNTEYAKVCYTNEGHHGFGFENISLETPEPGITEEISTELEIGQRLTTGGLFITMDFGVRTFQPKTGDQLEADTKVEVVNTGQKKFVDIEPEAIREVVEDEDTEVRVVIAGGYRSVISSDTVRVDNLSSPVPLDPTEKAYDDIVAEQLDVSKQLLTVG